MSEEEKQIEELARVICGGCPNTEECLHVMCLEWYNAKKIYNAGYRKQVEGEWIQQLRPYEDEIECSVCGARFNVIDNCTEKFDFCPACGAKMKGGE